MKFATPRCAENYLKIAIASASFSLLFLFLPMSAHADTNSLLNPIVPTECHCEGQKAPDGSTITTAPGYGCVLQTVQNGVNVLISISILVCVLWLAYAGTLFLASSASPGLREQGKTRIMNAVIGLVVILAAWLIIDFVMKALYNGDSSFGPWNSILASQSSDDKCIVAKNPTSLTSGSISIVSGTSATGASSGTGTSADANAAAGQEASSRKLLSDAGVSIWHGACQAGQSGGCTNVGGTRAATLQQVLNINTKVCGAGKKCGVVLTGGSEPGHKAGQYSHGTGYKIDIDDSAAVNTVLNALTHTGERGGDNGGPIFKDSCQNQYVHESTHWDITVFAACSL
ncbi:MAG: uncharacterized protein JWN49_470 [Parcubacteria group bacterium]|nr:uncharacterized protein [Parcubacteria group bacterium]